MKEVLHQCRARSDGRVLNSGRWEAQHKAPSPPDASTETAPAAARTSVQMGMGSMMLLPLETHIEQLVAGKRGRLGRPCWQAAL